ncbi:response regulator [Dyadobacter sp. CY345]|uniref:response regulator n=1 Tax=Dyadobacter sp. CY345 TaxID=2909335 RepID=UPI001F43A0A3|nr:response regulator [Dyadobacter sp. CY345]MCF2446981.1 response regulator [Dyadobacter sp. CY345]
MEPSSNISISSTSDCKILIVEDEYIIANDLEIILNAAGYPVIGIAKSVSKARALIDEERPDMVLLDIYLKGGETGIELAKQLEVSNIPFIYTSANDNQSVLEAIKDTNPSGYIVKPFRKKDILTAIQVARTVHTSGSKLTDNEIKVLQNALIENLSGTENWNDRILTSARLIQKYVPFDLLTIRSHTPTDANIFNYHRVGFDDYQILSVQAVQKKSSSPMGLEMITSAARPPEGLSLYSQKSLDELCQSDKYIELLVKTFKLNSALMMSFKSSDTELLSISFLSRKQEIYKPYHQQLLENIRSALRSMAERIMSQQALFQ